MKKSIVVTIDVHFFDKDDVDKLSTNNAIDVHIKDLGNNTPQDFVIPSVVVAIFSNITIGLLSSATYDEIKYLLKKIIAHSKGRIPQNTKRRLELYNTNGANVTVLYDAFSSDTELANAMRIVSDLSKDNYIVLVDKNHGVRIFTYKQFGHWKKENKC